MEIPRFKKENLGSLQKIEFLPAYAFDAFLPSVGGILKTDIVLKNGFDWYAIYCSQDTGGHQQDETLDDNGEIWTQQVVGFVPADEYEIEQALLQFKRIRAVARITLQNGSQKIVGLPTEPLDLIIKSSTQDTVPGRAGHSFNFNGKTTDRALFVL
jgi:hypothetical protein